MKARIRTRVYRITIITSFLIFLLNSVCYASKEQPIEIEADRMVAVEKNQSVVFSGNVDATQGDVRIRSDKMTIFYVEQKEGTKNRSKNAQQVKKIICKGNVEVTSTEWLGTSNTMHYFSKKKLVQLIGNAKAYKGQNMVQGERIDYHLDTGESEVFGAKTTTSKKDKSGKKSGRVNMTIREQ